MLYSKKTLIATAAATMFSASAFAGASLDTLLGGSSLFSGNGQLEFSDFNYDGNANAPGASDVSVTTLDDGLRFIAPAFSFSQDGSFDYVVSYKVTGINTQIDSVFMRATGSATGTGRSGVLKTVEDQANLTTAFSFTQTISTASASFAPQSKIYVFDDVFGIPGNGTAGLSDFRQTYGTTGGSTPTAVPSPTAALAGLALFGAVGLRRRRQA